MESRIKQLNNNLDQPAQQSNDTGKYASIIEYITIKRMVNRRNTYSHLWSFFVQKSQAIEERFTIFAVLEKRIMSFLCKCDSVQRMS